MPILYKLFALIKPDNVGRVSVARPEADAVNVTVELLDVVSICNVEGFDETNVLAVKMLPVVDAIITWLALYDGGASLKLLNLIVPPPPKMA